MLLHCIECGLVHNCLLMSPKCHCLTPASHQSLSAPLSLPHHWEQGENRKCKSQKTCGFRERQFNSTSKSWAHKQCKARYEFSAAHVWAGVQHLQESRAPSHAAVSWTDKCCHFRHPSILPFFSPQLYVLIMMSHGLQYVFLFGSPVLAVAPPSFLPSVTPPKQERLWKARAKTSVQMNPMFSTNPNQPQTSQLILSQPK